MKNFKDRLCGMNCHYRFYSFERFFQEKSHLIKWDIDIINVK